MKSVRIVCTATFVAALFVCIGPSLGFRSIAQAQSNDSVSPESAAAAEKAAAANKLLERERWAVLGRYR
jgi:hypothetical protein